jgi:membrane fusion protein (multidrug efflux system)
MASKPLYLVVAVVGIAAASGAAWWLQHRPSPLTQGTAGTSTRAPVQGASAARAPGPPTVEVARVETARVSDDAQAVGTLRSRQSVMLRPEVSGRVTRLNFRDGQAVRKGQLLVQLDDQLQLAQVQQAQAELSIAMANNKRNQELVAQNFISQRSVDESAANLQVAQAKLALAQATAARLRIVAPFDGVAGIRSVNLGDYLKDGADIVNIEDMEAIFVDFRLPERYQTKLQRGQNASVAIDALPGRSFNAVVQAIDPLVDANGRSVGVRGCIDNRQLQLRPGMFARITTVFSERPEARVIPEEAIVPQGGKQFVIKLVDGPDQDTRIAQRVEVKVGVRSPGRVEITQGLQPGDVVVTAGQQRIQKDGTPVRVLEVRGGAAAGRGGPGTTAPADVPPGNGMATRPAAPAASAAPRPEGASPGPAQVARAEGPAPGSGPASRGNPCAVTVAGR